MAKKLIVMAIMILFTSSAFAGVAGNTSDPKTPYGPGISNLEASGLGPIKLGFDVDWILGRDLEGGSGITNAEMEGQKYMLRLGYTFANRIEPYLKLGLSHFKASWDQGSEQAANPKKIKGENAMAWGLGCKALVFDIPEHGIRFSLDGNYFYTDAGVEEAYVGSPLTNVSATEFEVSEWQIAGILSREFLLNYDKYDTSAVYSIIPYVGLAYSDVEVNANFQSIAGAKYDIGAAESKDKFLLITGCDINSPENITLNVEGRWIGETAASGGLTLKF